MNSKFMNSKATSFVSIVFNESLLFVFVRFCIVTKLA